MALYTIRSWDEVDNIRRAPTSSQTALYNALGRNNGSNSDNFFAKRGKSIENALGTTFAAAVGGIDVGREDDLNKKRAEESDKGRKDIYKAAGFDNVDDYYNAKEAAERDAFGKIGFDIDSYWDNRANADIAGDKNTIARLDQEYNAAKSQIQGQRGYARACACIFCSFPACTQEGLCQGGLRPAE